MYMYNNMTDQSEVPTQPTEFENLLEIAAQMDEQAKVLRTRASEIRKGVKLLQKDMKVALASKRKKKVKDPNAPKREPAGFAKPTVLSPELCDFLKIEESTLVARTEVTKKITEYIKEHNLQNPANKREILLDGPLKTLLNPPSDAVVTFFTLQTYLKVHFPSSKANQDAVTRVTSPPVEESKSVSTKNVVSKPSIDSKKLAVKKKLMTPGRSKVTA